MMKGSAGRYKSNNTYKNNYYDTRKDFKSHKPEYQVERQSMPVFKVETFKELTLVNTRCLYVDGTPELLEEFKKMFDLQSFMCPYGKFEEIKVHKYKEGSNSYSDHNKVPKMLYVRFKYEFQASLLYKSINNFFIDFLHKRQHEQPPPHLRSYFKKSRFCTTMLHAKVCQKKDCQYLHKIYEKARYFEVQDDRTFNHNFDSAMAVKIIKENIERIRKLSPLFEDVKHLAGRFCHPMKILERLPAPEDRQHYNRDPTSYYNGYSDGAMDGDSESNESGDRSKTNKASSSNQDKEHDSDEEYVRVSRQPSEPVVSR